MRRWLLVLATVMGAQLTPAPADSGAPCAQSHRLIGRCFTIHGRMFFPNGNPAVRIGRIGTTRIVGVLDGAGSDESDDVLPASLRARLGPEWDNYVVYGDFEVCPLTRERPGRMQFVCIRSIADPAVRPQRGR